MNYSKKSATKRALREHFEVDMRYESLDIAKTSKMLSRVRGMLKESRTSRDFNQRQTSPAYLKMVMMEQALYSHYSDLMNNRHIVVENEEVEKSQVILAAQDMVDQIQKMVETVSKMNAEELPAVVDGISNEIGTSESESYSQGAAEALTTLLSALTAAKGSLSSALGQITGEGGGEGFGDLGGEEPEMGDEDLEAEEPADLGGEELPELPAPEEEEPEDLGGAGREMR